ncbi:MAG TPA: TonB-dependent receptor [Chthonomonadaceae bacterium]|nr:TonB-dependent receptor [Chthonomonadaceae bacterium]
MRDRLIPIPRLLVLVAMIGALGLLTTGMARADVYGRLRFSVKNADDEKPLPNAKIVLHDTAGVRPDITLTTDAQGMAASPQLEVRAWQATTNAEKADTFQTDTRQVTVVADTTTDVEILMEPLKEKVIRITGQRSLVNKSQTNNVTQINQQKLQNYPSSGGNPQSMQKVLLTAPGFVEDSVNQAHPRGEHASTTFFINGFELPDVLQGRAGAFLVPETIQNLDILTGGYAPEYGGETAAILNLTLRAGPIVPLRQAYLEGGEFGTVDGALTFGGQGGRPIGLPDAEGHVARKFGYFVDLNARTTDNVLEPPQPDNQTAHNHGESQGYFGNFTLNAGSRDDFSLMLNSAPAYTQVANRTGLPAFYAPYGQGYGFGGERDANGMIGAPVNPGGLGDTTLALPSQQAEGQNDYVRDVNDFGVLNWRHTLNPNLFALASFGIVHTGQNILNGNPAAPSLNSLPLDNSIEYNPAVYRNYHHLQGQGSLNLTAGTHTLKGGLLYDEQEGDESYQLIPASQLALDALNAADPDLAPAGTAQVDAQGNPVLDVNGYQVYTAAPGAVAPVLKVHRSGFYSAGYIQDTWNVSRRFTANYGLRLDWYDQKQTLTQTPLISTSLARTPVNQANLSPRINLAYLLGKRAIWRVSFNRLFIQPPLATGAIVGQAIQPETLSQYDTSLEKQIGTNQTVKIAYYAKNIRNQIDTGLLVPNTQTGIFSSVNFTDGNVHGVELTYDLTPRNNVGLGYYLSYTNSLAKPNGLVNGVPGSNAPDFNDHDQLNTISTGLYYGWKSGANMGLDFYYGSGVASSIVVDNTRSSHSRLNVSLSTGPGLFGGHGPNGHGGLTLIIENIYNDRSVINFNSGFSGTRFDQGRRILLQGFAKF